MKCNWIGKNVTERLPEGRFFSLLMYPVYSMSGDYKRELCELSGIPMLDIKVRVRTGGFFLLERGTKEELTARAGRLNSNGYRCRLFDEAAQYEVPEAIDTGLGDIRPDSIVFFDEAVNVALEIAPDDRVLIVTGRVEIVSTVSTNTQDNVVGYPGFGHGGLGGMRVGMQGMRMPARASSSRKAKKVGVVDIYNMTRGQCARITERAFDFRDYFSGDADYSFLVNCRKMIDGIKKFAAGTVVDDCYEETSLPLGVSDTEKHSSQSGDMFGISSSRTVTRSDMSRFNQYSKFRCIIQTIDG